MKKKITSSSRCCSSCLTLVLFCRFTLDAAVIILTGHFRFFPLFRTFTSESRVAHTRLQNISSSVHFTQIKKILHWPAGGAASSAVKPNHKPTNKVRAKISSRATASRTLWTVRTPILLHRRRTEDKNWSSESVSLSFWLTIAVRKQDAVWLSFSKGGGCFPGESSLKSKSGGLTVAVRQLPQQHMKWTKWSKDLMLWK